MNFWEGLCAFALIVILGFYGFLILAKKLGLLNDGDLKDDKKEDEKVYKEYHDKPKKEKKDKKETK